MKLPSVYDYADYRKYLADIFNHLKETRRMTIRDFLKLLGFQSSGYYSMLMKKQRSLRRGTARKVAHRLGMAGTQIDFFETLVRFSDAEEDSDRETHLQALLKFKKFRDARKARDGEFHLFRSWVTLAVYEMCAVAHFAKMSAGQMAKSLKPAVAASEVEESLALLKSLELIDRQDGHWTKKDAVYQTDPELQSLHFRAYHREMIDRSSYALDHTAVTERGFYGLTIALTPDQFAAVKSRLFEIQKELNAEFSDASPTSRAVYQIQMQVFPLADADPSASG